MSLFTIKRSLVPISFCIGFPLIGFAQQLPAAEESIVDATVERITVQKLVGEEQFAERKLLFNIPRVSVMRWQTDDEAFGSDETELTLEFDFLSPSQRKLLRSSEQLRQAYQSLKLQQLELEASRLIRRLYWQYQQAKIELSFAQKTAQQLSDLHQTIKSQVAAGAKTNYAVLISEQRWHTAVGQAKQLETAVYDLAERWQRLTGQDKLPETLNETFTDSVRNAATSQQHPSLAVLDLQWQLTLAEAQQNARSQSSWTVATGFKRISSATSENENQWGLGLTIPLNFNQSLSPFEMMTLKQQQTDILSSLRETRFAIENDISEADSRVERAQIKLQTTMVTAELSKQVIMELQQLYQQQQLDTQLYIDRLLEQLRQQKTAALAHAELGLAQALLNQAQGIAL